MEFTDDPANNPTWLLLLEKDHQGKTHLLSQ
jgi:hypothetical protein